jgi:hypothetical protein
MIEHARASGYFSVVGPAYWWQMQPPAVNVCRAHGFGTTAPLDL